MTLAYITAEKGVAAGQPDAELLEKMTAAKAMLKKGAKGAMTTFAETLLVLLEVTSQLAELDATCQEAMQAPANENDDTRKWREISHSTLQFARTSLQDQQLRAIEVLQDLSERGGSMVTDPDQARSADPLSKLIVPQIQAAGLGKGPPPGFSCVGPPPGLPALPAPVAPVTRPPPGFEALPSTTPTTSPTYLSRPKALSAPVAVCHTTSAATPSGGGEAAPWQSSRAKAAAAAVEKTRQQASPEDQHQGWVPTRPKASDCAVDEVWWVLSPATVGIGALLKQDAASPFPLPSGDGVAAVLNFDEYDY